MKQETSLKTKTQNAQDLKSRCRNCKWVHEADSVEKTSFMGVELCHLHAAAPDLLEQLKNALIFIETVHGGKNDGAVQEDIRAAITKATKGLEG